jgi:hypothetical protein
LLQALKTEFEENLAIIDGVIQSNQKIREGLLKYIEFSGPEYDSISEEACSKLLGDISYFSVNFEPGLGVFNDASGSGKLSIISDEKLRRLLATWEASLEAITKQEAVVENNRERIKQILIDKGNLSAMAKDAKSLNFGKYRFSDDVRTILAYQPLTNVVLFKLGSSGSLLRLYEKVKKDIEEILSLIDSQLK